ncbi:hypothetical protein CHISP_3070 [Chitinispirillum alkaliphilum]|nr:hypothetical protein CHISP_3070 [Chitinispirillum alkaliphilum]
MRCTLILFVMAVVFCNSAHADGFFLSKREQRLQEPSQKAVIAWEDSTQIMILSSAVKAQEPDGFAWIVPIISKTKPEVDAGDISLFEEYATLFSGHPLSDISTIGIGYGAGSGSVTIVEVLKIDIYSITVLKATDAEVLFSWLLQNDYHFDSKIKPILDHYIKTGLCYFVINSIDFTASIEGENLSPEEEAAERRRHISQLNRGISTPLAFTFTPPYPYFPLKISSIGGGTMTRIEVYFVSSGRVRDVNNILDFSNFKRMSSQVADKTREVLEGDFGDYINLFVYSGLLNGLIDDAVFEFVDDSY